MSNTLCTSRPFLFLIKQPPRFISVVPIPNLSDRHHTFIVPAACGRSYSYLTNPRSFDSCHCQNLQIAFSISCPGDFEIVKQRVLNFSMCRSTAVCACIRQRFGTHCKNERVPAMVERYHRSI